MEILSKEFFSNYIFHSFAEELSGQDKVKSLICSIALGFFTLGFCHLVCAIIYHNHTYSICKKKEFSTTSKVDKLVIDKAINKKEPKSYTFDELMNSDINKDTLFYHANNRVNLWGLQCKFNLMKKAADMGHVEAMFELGCLYYYGLHNGGNEKIEKDISKAIEWLTKSVNKGNWRACEMLGNIYYNGNDIQEDKEEGKKMFLLGFQNGAERISIKSGRSIRFFREGAMKNFFEEKN